MTCLSCCKSLCKCIWSPFKFFGRMIANLLTCFFCCGCCRKKQGQMTAPKEIDPAKKEDDPNKSLTSSTTSDDTKEIAQVLNPLLHGKDEHGEIDELDFYTSNKETQTEESSFAPK